MPAKKQPTNKKPHPFAIDPAAKAAALADLTSSANKKWGAGTLDVASNKIEELKINPLPTPSLKLNEILAGGIMEGRIIEIFGPENSGKTFLTYQIIAEDMKRYPDSLWLWLETEGSYSEDDAVMMGVDTKRLHFEALNDNGAEELMDKMEACIRKLMVVKHLLRGVVVNSVAGLTPADELVTLHNKQHMGLLARLMSKHMRKIIHVAHKAKCTVVYINQIRDKISMYGGTSTTGGRALRFYASQRIELRKASDSNANWDINRMMKIDVKIHKNRLHKGNPFKSTSIYAVYGQGIDSGIEVAELAVTYGIIQRHGAWYTYIRQAGTDANGAPIYDTLKFNGSMKVLEYLNANPNIKQELYDLVSAQFLRTTDIDIIEQQAIQAADNDDTAEFNNIEYEEAAIADQIPIEDETA